MQIKTLSDSDLVARFTKLVRTERKITHLVLECIAEIDTRRLYLDRAYPSLFEYLTVGHGYSPAAAQRRISSARLLSEVPDLGAKIEDGKLNLSQIALATQQIKIAEKKFETKMETSDKVQLLERLESQSLRETERILAEELKVKPALTERVQYHDEGSVTVTLTFTKEQFEKWNRVRELVSHAVPNQRHTDVAIHLAEKELARRTEIRRTSPALTKRSKSPRQIAPNTRKIILGHQTSEPTSATEVTARQATPKGCAYTDPLTGRHCGSKYLLQIDHIRPVHAGGENDIQNLRALCAAHNRRRFETGHP